MTPTLLSHDKMRVNLELYSEKAREGAVSALKQGFGCSDIGPNDSTMYGITGSFRKLEVDWNALSRLRITHTCINPVEYSIVNLFYLLEQCYQVFYK